MENNNLKEKIRKNVKEKIAVSNIREEFDMKKNKNKKVIYLITSSVAVFVLCVGIGINYNNTIKNKTELGKMNNSNIEYIDKEGINVQENDTIIFNTESIKSMASISGKFVESDVDGEWKDKNLTEMFSFIKDIDILKRYDNLRQGIVYVKEDPKDANYSKLQQYELIYYMNGNNAPSVQIIFTKEDKILQCMIPDENNYATSTISNNKVKLFKVENFEDKNKINGGAFFEYSGYKFYVESYKIDENDFINIIKSIFK